MGSGNYSSTAHEALVRGRANIPVQQVFKQSKCHPLIDPKGIRLRESSRWSRSPTVVGNCFCAGCYWFYGRNSEAYGNPATPHLHENPVGLSNTRSSTPFYGSWRCCK